MNSKAARSQSAGHWLSGAFNPAHKGLLHRSLGVPADKKIPLDKLKSAASKGGKLAMRARLALEARSFHH
jgi:hypothetical protein